MLERECFLLVLNGMLMNFVLSDSICFSIVGFLWIVVWDGYSC